MKWKFWKKCELYDKENITCTKNAGGYYPSGLGLRVAGGYIEMKKGMKIKPTLFSRLFSRYNLLVKDGFKENQEEEITCFYNVAIREDK